jgi:hypothetical protein
MPARLVMLTTELSWNPFSPNSAAAASSSARNVRRPRSVRGVFAPPVIVALMSRSENIYKDHSNPKLKVGSTFIRYKIQMAQSPRLDRRRVL